MILLLDPASDPIRVGLADGAAVVAEAEVADRRELSRTLLGQIDALCSQTGTSVGLLEGIAVVVGPGPFTSLRIGLAVANSLAAAGGVPLVGVPAEGVTDLAGLAAATREALKNGDTAGQLFPAYGKPPTITPPKPKT